MYHTVLKQTIPEQAIEKVLELIPFVSHYFFQQIVN